MPFSIAFMLFLETPALSESCSWVILTDFLISSRLFLRFLWSLPKIYFFSYSSTASVNSFPVFGYRYPAIKVPTPIAPTKAPTPFNTLPSA